MKTPSQLRQAAERYARRRYPDQTVSVPSTAFAKRTDRFVEVRMSGGSVLIPRSVAERE